MRQQQRSARLRSAAAVEIQRGARVWLARQEASRRRNLRDGVAEPVRLLRCLSLGSSLSFSLTCHVLCWRQDEESSPEGRGERERLPLWAPRQAAAAPAAAAAAAVALESVSETAPAVAWEGLLRGAKP